MVNWMFKLKADPFVTLTIKEIMWGYHSKNLAKIGKWRQFGAKIGFLTYRILYFARLGERK